MKSQGVAQKPTELSLDPEDWESFRDLGRRMVDDMIAFVRGVSERPSFTPVPEQVKSFFRAELPRKAQGAEAVYEEFLRNVLPYAKGNIHPRFWGWVEGSGTPIGMLASLLSGAMNSNVAFGDQSAVYMELQVLDWFKEMLGFPQAASGLLLSGGSMANLVGLAAARDSRGDPSIPGKGVDPARRALRMYASAETHNSVDRAVKLLGLGREGLVRIPTGEDYRIDLSALRAAIARDREAGRTPFCLVANAGTVNTGAIDPISDMAELAAAEGLWLHVDAAIGFMAALLPEFEAALAPASRADSIAFDLHKWMYAQYETGCLLVREPAALEASFKHGADYLVSHERGVSAGPVAFADRGPELSRGFRALKVWMQLKEAGLERHAALVAQNVDQARYLASLVGDAENLELMAPPSLNIVCFRYNPGTLDAEALNSVNREILLRLQERGIATPSYTMLRGAYVIRVAITNHRSVNTDFELLASEVERLGRELA